MVIAQTCIWNGAPGERDVAFTMAKPTFRGLNRSGLDLFADKANSLSSVRASHELRNVNFPRFIDNKTPQE